MNIPSIEEIISQDIGSMRKCPDKMDCVACPESTCVKVVLVSDFPTEAGHFAIIGFVNNKDYKDHIIILRMMFVLSVWMCNLKTILEKVLSYLKFCITIKTVEFLVF